MALLITKQVNNTLDSVYDEVINPVLTLIRTTAPTTNTLFNVERIRTVTFEKSATIKGIWIAFYSAHHYSTLRAQHTFTLQENVSGTWTTRATAIIPEGRQYHYGCFAEYLQFDQNVNVDTSSNKWRLRGIAGVLTSSVPLYAIMDENSVMTTGFVTTNELPFIDAADRIIVSNGHTLTIDRSVTFNAVVNGTDTANGYCIVLSSDANLYFAPNQPTTINMNGSICPYWNSFIRVGEEGSRIDETSEIIFNVANCPGTTLASTNVSFIKGTLNNATYLTMRGIELWGKVPLWRDVQLTENANIGINTIVVNEVPSDWRIGDSIRIGKANTTGQSEINIDYKILNIIGNQIVLDRNIGAHQRLIGGRVINLTNRFIKFRNGTLAAYITLYMGSFGRLIWEGVDGFRMCIQEVNTVSYIYNVYGHISTPLEGRIKQTIVRGNSFWSENANFNVVFLITGGNIEDYFEDNVAFITHMLYTHRTINFKGLTVNYKQKRLFFKNYTSINGHLGEFYTSDANMKLTAENIVIQNSRLLSGAYGMLRLSCVDSTVTNFTTYGGQSPLYLVNNNGLLIRNLNVERSTQNVIFALLSNVNVTIDNLKYENVNLNLLEPAVFSYFQNFVINLKGNPTDLGINPLIYDCQAGSEITLLNQNDITGNDVILTETGTKRKTGENLPDTTSLNKYALRLEPVTDTISFKQRYPIGNLMCKYLSVQYKIKIGSENYWSTEHTLPTLRVTYDGSTIIEQIAQPTTNQQNLIVGFIPQTETGVIEIELFGNSNTVAPDNYFYLLECIVNKPDGSSLELSKLDLWYNGSPIVPTIATMPDYSQNIFIIKEKIDDVKEDTETLLIDTDVIIENNDITNTKLDNQNDSLIIIEEKTNIVKNKVEKLKNPAMLVGGVVLY